MTDKTCPRYSGCNCQLCPRDEASLRGATWFASEDVCSLKHAGGTPHFVRIQKRIQAVVTGDGYEPGSFTFAMLEALDRVKKGIRGVDPDSYDQPRLRAEWIAARKRRAKKTLSGEQKRQLAERGRSALSAYRHKAATAGAEKAEGSGGPEGQTKAVGAKTIGETEDSAGGPSEAQIAGREHWRRTMPGFFHPKREARSPPGGRADGGAEEATTTETKRCQTSNETRA